MREEDSGKGCGDSGVIWGLSGEAGLPFRGGELAGTWSAGDARGLSLVTSTPTVAPSHRPYGSTVIATTNKPVRAIVETRSMLDTSTSGCGLSYDDR